MDESRLSALIFGVALLLMILATVSVAFVEWCRRRERSRCVLNGTLSCRLAGCDIEQRCMRSREQ